MCFGVPKISSFMIILSQLCGWFFKYLDGRGVISELVELIEPVEEDYGQCEILPLSNLLSRLHITTVNIIINPGSLGTPKSKK